MVIFKDELVYCIGNIIQNAIQHANLNTISDFKSEIASSRTFCFLHELEELIDNNLVKGGDINNAIVIVENKVTNEKLIELKKVFNNPKIKVSKNGYLNNLTLRINYRL